MTRTDRIFFTIVAACLTGVFINLLTMNLSTVQVVLIGLTLLPVIGAIGYTIAGRIYQRLRPDAVRPWRQWIGTVLSPADVLTYRLMGVSLDEAARLGNRTPAEYRWIRRYERRSGMQFDERIRPAQYERLPEVLRRTLSAYSGPWRSKKIRSVAPETLRALAVLGKIQRGPTNVPHMVFDEAIAGMRDGASPADTVGWVVAYQTALDEEIIPANFYLDIFQQTYRATGDVPGWLKVLAGIGPEEDLPTDVDSEGLLTLAALRGQRTDLITLVIGPTADPVLTAPMTQP